MIRAKILILTSLIGAAFGFVGWDWATRGIIPSWLGIVICCSGVASFVTSYILAGYYDKAMDTKINSIIRELQSMPFEWKSSSPPKDSEET